MATEAGAVKDNRNTNFCDDNRRILYVHYTNYNTKLFVENGVLVEEQIQSPCQVCQNSGVSTYYTCCPSPKRPPPTDADEAGQLTQDIETAKVALDYYNTKHKDKYELVDAINSNGCLWASGLWFHCSFRVKLEGSSASSTKLFFAELKVAKFEQETKTTKFLVTACRPLEGKTTTQCEMCKDDDTLLHPSCGFRQGRYPYHTRVLRPRAKGKFIPSKNSKVSPYKAEGEAPPLSFGPSY
ncbi:uncharacterized protein LOC141615366 [Silene latifolia]|uniref:uncharacterized protein LOC141615366 n=1 Tax=Silene latifolia TaxID=37657 RepID=UPI003D77E1CA